MNRVPRSPLCLLIGWPANGAKALATSKPERRVSATWAETALLIRPSIDDSSAFSSP